MLYELKKPMKLLITVVLLCVMGLSMTVVVNQTTDVENHVSTIQMLDEKKMTAIEMTAAVAAASTAVAAVPGDATTPIAEQISELTNPLLLVVCTIYLEKFLLTTMGYISFMILIPLACGLLMCHLWINRPSLQLLAVKTSVFALVLYLLIPTSVMVTKLIEDTFDQSIEVTYNTVEEIETEELVQEETSSGWISGILSGIQDTASDLSESAERALSAFVDAIAVIVITTCVIPIAVILFAIWFIKFLFGIKINLPKIQKTKRIVG